MLLSEINPGLGIPTKASMRRLLSAQSSTMKPRAEEALLLSIQSSTQSNKPAFQKFASIWCHPGTSLTYEDEGISVSVVTNVFTTDLDYVSGQIDVAFRLETNSDTDSKVTHPTRSRLQRHASVGIRCESRRPHPNFSWAL